jgi:tryptophan aminotransferase
LPTNIISLFSKVDTSHSFFVDRLITLRIDDPYYYLYFGKAARPPSYFRLELDGPEVGRVIRFDSFSKVLSAGMRIGFASGPKPIIDAINLHVRSRGIRPCCAHLTFTQTATANLQPSSLVQAITISLVEEWGYDNFFAHTRNVADFYRKKRDVFESALNVHLDGLAEWCTPEAGMFFWFVHPSKINPAC